MRLIQLNDATRASDIGQLNQWLREATSLLQRMGGVSRGAGGSSARRSSAGASGGGSGSGGGGGTTLTWESETPTGTVDDVNDTFTLSQTPVANSLHLYLNGVLQRPGVEYGLSGTTITMSDPPQTGTPDDWLFAVYPYE